jgi:hypothetical protein
MISLSHARSKHFSFFNSIWSYRTILLLQLASLPQRNNEFVFVCLFFVFSNEANGWMSNRKKLNSQPLVPAFVSTLAFHFTASVSIP